MYVRGFSCSCLLKEKFNFHYLLQVALETLKKIERKNVPKIAEILFYKCRNKFYEFHVGVTDT